MFNPSTKKDLLDDLIKRKQEYINMYRDNKYDRLEIILPKGRKEQIKAAAAAADMTTSEYIAALVAADIDGAGASKTARIKGLTAEQRAQLDKWQVPKKYIDMIEAITTDTDEARQVAAAAGKRIACCQYTIYLKAGYINDITGGRVIRTDKTKEIRRIITHTHAVQ